MLEKKSLRVCPIYGPQEAVRNPSFSSIFKSVAIPSNFLGQFVPQQLLPPKVVENGVAGCFALLFPSQTC
jgi:hypothetical protein